MTEWLLPIFELFGGLALFLYGMNVMSNSLEKRSGGKLTKGLRKATSNPFKGLLLGAAITVAVQSSSAVTVMLVGLVNSGVMELFQTVGVIFGADIGTTLTVWILTLLGIDGDNFFVMLLKPSTFTPLVALIGVVMTSGSDELMLASHEGKANRFKETDVRGMGRSAAGVNGMTLEEGDYCVGLMVVSQDCTVLTVSESGLGKRSDFEDYRLTKRGSKGVVNMNVTDKTGPVVSCMTVQETDEVMIITSKGMVVRTPVNGIRVIGRNTQGVKVIRLKEDDSVVAVARVVVSDSENSAPAELDEISAAPEATEQGEPADE